MRLRKGRSWLAVESSPGEHVPRHRRQPIPPFLVARACRAGEALEQPLRGVGDNEGVDGVVAVIVALLAHDLTLFQSRAASPPAPRRA